MGLGYIARGQIVLLLPFFFSFYPPYFRNHWKISPSLSVRVLFSTIERSIPRVACLSLLSLNIVSQLIGVSSRFQQPLHGDIRHGTLGRPPSRHQFHRDAERERCAHHRRLCVHVQRQETKMFQCRTRGCKCSVIISEDEDGHITRGLSFATILLTTTSSEQCGAETS